MNIAICQTNVLPIKEESLASYFKYLQKNSVVVFGEYVFDLFFTELQNTQKTLIAQLAEQKILLLQKMAKHYKLKIVAPLIVVEGEKIYKKIAIIDSKKTDFYMQQRLINYAHWNEEKFFDNPKNKTFKLPYIFEHDGLKVAVLFGFELHFDALWLKIKDENVDVVILPTASTFGSKERWQILCRSRAFFNSCMIVRVNRIGKVLIQEEDFEFYGESFVVNPSAEFEEKLDHKESVVCFEISKEDLRAQVQEWGFRKITKGKK